MPDKLTSVGGQIVFQCNKASGAAAVLSWRAKALRRKVTSSLAAECYAIVATIGELIYIKAVLSLIFGSTFNEIPTYVMTDSKNLFESIYSSKLCDDKWLITDVVSIKEAINEKQITKVLLVPENEMIANCLAKSGASNCDLMRVLESGQLPMKWLPK